MTGRIASLLDSYGFISPDHGGENIFFHASDVAEVYFRELRLGDPVSYVPQPTIAGPARGASCSWKTGRRESLGSRGHMRPNLSRRPSCPSRPAEGAAGYCSADRTSPAVRIRRAASPSSTTSRAGTIPAVATRRSATSRRSASNDARSWPKLPDPPISICPSKRGNFRSLMKPEASR